jgi:DNA polymerase-4
MMQELTPLVQPLSIDEAFLELKGTERLHHDPPARVLARFAQRVEKEVGITISIGLSYCKFLAKVASDLNKPRGFSVIGEAEALAFLREKPVRLIWGVGKAFAETLERDGIRTVGQLQTMEETDLMRRYGVMGKRLFNLSRGQDDREVHPNDPAKSVSAETTFFDDISSYDELVAHLRRLSEKVATRLRKSGIAGHTVVLKLKTADFKGRTRNRKLEDPTMLADRIFRTGIDLLRKEVDGTKYRLIGIGVSDLADPGRADPPDLVDPAAARRAAAEAAMNVLRDKFGKAGVETGYTFGKSGPGRFHEKLTFKTAGKIGDPTE